MLLSCKSPKSRLESTAQHDNFQNNKVDKLGKAIEHKEV